MVWRDIQTALRSPCCVHELQPRNTARHGATRRCKAQHGATRRGTAQHGATRRNTAQHGARKENEHKTRPSLSRRLGCPSRCFESVGVASRLGPLLPSRTSCDAVIDTAGEGAIREPSPLCGGIGAHRPAAGDAAARTPPRHSPLPAPYPTLPPPPFLSPPPRLPFPSLSHPHPLSLTSCLRYDGETALPGWRPAPQGLQATGEKWEGLFSCSGSGPGCG
jgi:hypothetical protein